MLCQYDRKQLNRSCSRLHSSWEMLCQHARKQFSCEMKFSMDLARTCYRPKQRSLFWLNLLKIHWSPRKDQAWEQLQRPALTGQAMIFDLKIFEQPATENNHLQCYWQTIHNSILKIYPKFQVLRSHFSEVKEPVWWMSIRIDSILAFSTDLKESNCTQVILGFLSR